MSDTADILLLSDADKAPRLAQGLGDDAVMTHCTDPYDALLEMARRRWPAVVLTVQDCDFAGLCRGARRLQDKVGLFAVCTAAEEPDVKKLTDGVIDDYFISPPTRKDLSQLREALARGASNAQPSLAPEDFARLAESARNTVALEAGLVELLSKRIGAVVKWTDVEDVPQDVSPLLFAADDRPRVLTPQGKLSPLDAEMTAFISAVQQCLPSLFATARRSQSLHRLAVTDHLTGTYNRRYFYHVTDEILRRLADKNINATLLLYDIDNFKHYNDTYGYAAGDEILRETAALMKQTTRSHDIVARIGGDEFAVLFWDAEKPRSPNSHPLEDAYALADRFRQAVTEHRFASLGPEATGTLTISGGLASFPKDAQTCRGLLRQADKAIKAAKKSGKNAIQLVG